MPDVSVLVDSSLSLVRQMSQSTPQLATEVIAAVPGTLSSLRQAQQMWQSLLPEGVSGFPVSADVLAGLGIDIGSAAASGGAGGGGGGFFSFKLLKHLTAAMREGLKYLWASIVGFGMWKLAVKAVSCVFTPTGHRVIGCIAVLVIGGVTVHYFFHCDPNDPPNDRNADDAGATSNSDDHGGANHDESQETMGVFTPTGLCVVGCIAVLVIGGVTVHYFFGRGGGESPPAQPVSGPPQAITQHEPADQSPRNNNTDGAEAAPQSWSIQFPSGSIDDDARICPITRAPFVDPVITSDGHTYERAAIQEWFDLGHTTSPMTNVELPDQHLIPNIAMRPRDAPRPPPAT